MEPVSKPLTSIIYQNKDLTGDIRMSSSQELSKRIHSLVYNNTGGKSYKSSSCSRAQKIGYGDIEKSLQERLIYEKKLIQIAGDYMKRKDFSKKQYMIEVSSNGAKKQEYLFLTIEPLEKKIQECTGDLLGLQGESIYLIKNVEIQIDKNPPPPPPPPPYKEKEKVPNSFRFMCSGCYG